MSYFPLTNTGGVVRNPEVDYENAILESFGVPPGKTADEDLAGADVADDTPAVQFVAAINGANICQAEIEPANRY
ncbi:MAG TPA: hypothetical protein VFX79_01975 [Candidatus Saccharimonadales bacterium]|nr:hypothetical protein [Candidatus Saccharimonadales bacterium]